MAGVLCVGIATLDYVYGVDAIPTTAIKHRAKAMTVVGGGLSANAAVAVARLGGPSFMASRLGADLAGNEIIAGLEREGVDCRFVRRFDTITSPVSAIMVDKAGERLVLSYSDFSSVPDPSWLPDALPASVGAVCGDTRWIEGSAKMFDLARQRGFAGVLDADRAPTDPSILERATHIAASAQALLEMTGTSDPEQGLAILRGRLSGFLAVTIGQGGVWYLEGDRPVHVPGFAVKAVDTLAAGDVWHGSFAWSLAQGMTEREAVRFASAAAAIKCTRFGGRSGAPTATEVRDFLRSA